VYVAVMVVEVMDVSVVCVVSVVLVTVDVVVGHASQLIGHLAAVYDGKREQ